MFCRESVRRFFITYALYIAWPEKRPDPPTFCGTQISKVVEQLKAQLVEKGKEINAYKSKHNIRTQEEIAMLEREKAQNK